jgi:hypothetical protein
MPDECTEAKETGVPMPTLLLCCLVRVQGVANRGASVRVGRETEQNGKGYFEDRRPASNMDPYVVTSMIADTTIIWKP